MDVRATRARSIDSYLAPVNALHHAFRPARPSGRPSEEQTSLPSVVTFFGFRAFHGPSHVSIALGTPGEPRGLVSVIVAGDSEPPFQKREPMIWPVSRQVHPLAGPVELVWLAFES